MGQRHPRAVLEDALEVGHRLGDDANDVVAMGCCRDVIVVHEGYKLASGVTVEELVERGHCIRHDPDLVEFGACRHANICVAWCVVELLS